MSSLTKFREVFCLGIIDPGMQEKLNAVASFFDSIDFAYTLENDILHRLWSKFMLNVGVNQACMVFETGYGVISEEGVFPTPSWWRLCARHSLSRVPRVYA